MGGFRFLYMGHPSPSDVQEELGQGVGLLAVVKCEVPHPELEEGGMVRPDQDILLVGGALGSKDEGRDVQNPDSLGYGLPVDKANLVRPEEEVV